MTSHSTHVGARISVSALGALVVLMLAGTTAFSQPAPGSLDVEVARQPTAPEGPPAAAPPPALATPPGTAEPAPPSGYPTWDGAGAYDAAQTPVPPGAEGSAVPSSYGGYCYVGPHPVDTRITPGSPWDPTEGQHLRPYAPIDLRLFSYHEGCYYFIGDPSDFGYQGPTSSYYGAHPILASYGGGWCFMMGGHSHLFAPWSPYFTVVGSWNYWRGPYDPFFWTYWPYYSTYYRAFYPHYYGGGRFFRGGGYRVAPAIGRGFRGQPARGGLGASPRGGLAPPVRGAAGAPVTRAAPPSGHAPAYSAVAPRGFPPGGHAFGYPAASVRGFAAPVPARPAFSSPPRTMSAPAYRTFSPSGGGFHGSGGSLHGGGSGGGFHGGGSFRGGGSARGGRR